MNNLAAHKVPTIPSLKVLPKRNSQVITTKVQILAYNPFLSR
jgi:hypothetical protein